MDVVIVVQRQTDLLEVVLALRASSRLARLLHSRQQNRDQNRDNENHDQQFDEGESTAALT